VSRKPQSHPSHPLPDRSTDNPSLLAAQSRPLQSVPGLTQALPRQIEIVGAAVGCGARDPRCEYGPDALREWGLEQHLDGLAQLATGGSHARWVEQVYPHYGSTRTEPDTIVPEFSQRLLRAVASVHKRGGFPLVVGGDHSCGIGTWSGVHQGVRQRGAMGLIWIDAHMDSHTPDTTPTGALHGMPLATLLGYGDPRLVGVGDTQAKLAARHTCLIGVRSFEEGEAALIEELGVRVFFAEEVRTRGMAPVLAEALAIVQAGTVGFGVSIDLDAVDPADAPGVGSPVGGGIGGAELVQALAQLADNPRLLGLEIAEYNPFLDTSGVTRDLVLRLAAAALLSAAEPADRLATELAA
jgi:arginase